MVKYEEKTYYVCPYCSSEYEDEDEAFDCAKECIIPDDVNILLKQVYTCEICEKEYTKRLEALSCEDTHKEKKDRVYQLYLEEKERQKLLRAASHHNQKKLF